MRDAVGASEELGGVLFRHPAIAVAGPDAAILFRLVPPHTAAMRRGSLPAATWVLVDYYWPGVTTNVEEPNAADTGHQAEWAHSDLPSAYGHRRVLGRYDIDLEPDAAPVEG